MSSVINPPSSGNSIVLTPPAAGNSLAITTPSGNSVVLTTPASSSGNKITLSPPVGNSIVLTPAAIGNALTITPSNPANKITLSPPSGGNPIAVYAGIAGPQGLPGIAGINGVSPTLSVNSIVGTVPSGTAGSASLNNTDPSHPILLLTLPAGAQGAQGSTGPSGATGTSPTLSVSSTVSTVPSGTAGSASLNNTDPSHPVLLLTLPAGPTGATGAQGSPGSTGPSGTAATVTVGTTTTGSIPAVSNSGTSSAAVLNFTLPSGGSGGSSTIPTNFTVNLQNGVTLGSYTNGSTIAAGTSLLTVVENILTTVIPATYTNPDCYVIGSGSTTVEYGTAISSTITLVFDQYDAGSATAYSIKLDGSQVATTFTYSYSVSSLTSSHTFSGSVTYAQGPQKKDNLGNNSGTPIPSGTVNSLFGPTFTPVRAMFYAANTLTSAPTTSAGIRGLSSPDISGNTSFSISAATGSTGLTIALPNSRTLTQVSFTQNGVTSPVPVANFSTSTVSVNGANGSTAANDNVYFLPILGGLGSAGTFNVTTT